MVPSNRPEFVTGPETIPLPGSKVWTLRPWIFLQSLFVAAAGVAFPRTPRKLLADCAEVVGSINKPNANEVPKSAATILIFVFIPNFSFFGWWFVWQLVARLPFAPWRSDKNCGTTKRL